MSEIIFARSRHIYQSYSDFWRLVELSGYPTCFVDEINFQSKNLYITTPMNGDYREHLENHKDDRQCTLVHWMLERPDKSVQEFAEANQELVELHLVDVNICSDPAMAHDTESHYVPMGSHHGLGLPGLEHEKKYDAIGLMAYTGRRAFLFAQPGKMKTHWEGISLAPNAWGSERDRLLRASLIGINVHKDEFGYSEPLRFAVFAAYGLVVVSEPFKGETPYDAMTYAASTETLADKVKHILGVFGNRRGFAARQDHCFLNSFRTCLEKYL